MADAQGVDYSLDVTIGDAERSVTFTHRYGSEALAMRDYNALIGGDVQVLAQLIRHSPESSKIIASALLPQTNTERS